MCADGSELAYIEKSDGLLYAYCVNYYPFEVSCYDKYLCNYNSCSICNGEISRDNQYRYSKGISFEVDEERIVEVCFRCNEKIKKILFRDGDIDSSTFSKYECCLCLNITNSDYVISRFDLYSKGQYKIYFCKNCADITQELTGLVFK